MTSILAVGAALFVVRLLLFRRHPRDGLIWGVFWCLLVVILNLIFGEVRAKKMIDQMQRGLRSSPATSPRRSSVRSLTKKPDEQHQQTHLADVEQLIKSVPDITAS